MVGLERDRGWTEWTRTHADTCTNRTVNQWRGTKERADGAEIGRDLRLLPMGCARKGGVWGGGGGLPQRLSECAGWRFPVVHTGVTFQEEIVYHLLVAIENGPDKSFPQNRGGPPDFRILRMDLPWAALRLRPTPCMTFRRSLASVWGPGQSPVLPLAEYAWGIVACPAGACPPPPRPRFLCPKSLAHQTGVRRGYRTFSSHAPQSTLCVCLSVYRTNICCFAEYQILRSVF